MLETRISCVRTVPLQQQQDALAERIAAVLRMRKKLGAERRLQERHIQERAFAGRYSPESEPDRCLRWNSTNGLTLG
jgi:hypothetical protein